VISVRLLISVRETQRTLRPREELKALAPGIRCSGPQPALQCWTSRRTSGLDGLCIVSIIRSAADVTAAKVLKSSGTLRISQKVIEKQMSRPVDAYQFGSFKLDAVARVLLREGEPVALTQKVFDLLLLLIENRGNVVEKDRLMKEIWPDTFVEEGNLTQNISILRKLLDDGHQYIQTVPRRGYRFVGYVQQVAEANVIVEEHSLARVVIEESADPGGATNSRSRKLGLASAVGVVVIFAVLLGWTLYRPRHVASRNPPPFDVSNVTLRKITRSGNVVYGLLSPDGQFVSYSTLDGESRYAVWLQKAGSKDALQLIAPTTEPVGPVSISHDNNWIYYGQQSDDDSGRRLSLYRMPIFGGSPRKVLDGIHVFADLSPDDRRILLHRFTADGGIQVLSVNAFDGSDERIIASSNTAADYMGTRWSPDGRSLLFFRVEKRADSNYWSLCEMPSDGGPVRTILAPAPRKIWFVAWTDGGRGIVMTATDPATKIPQLYYVAYPTGETHRITNDLVNYTTISVGGESILAGDVERQSKIWLLDWSKANTSHQIIDIDMVDGLSWTPDSHIIYDAVDDGRSHLWIADADGNQRQQLSPDSTDERQPCVSPDGRQITFISKRTGNVALWVMDIDGRNARQLTPAAISPWRPQFTPDGRSIVFLMDQGSLPVLARISIAGGEPSVIADDVTGETFFDISPDGRQIAYSTFNRTRNVTQIVVRSIEGDSTRTYFDIEAHGFVRWTPDGKNLMYAHAPEDNKRGAALWVQPVNGGPPSQVLNATPDLIYWIAWSRDGKRLLASRGRFTTDVVLLNRKRASL